MQAWSSRLSNLACVLDAMLENAYWTYKSLNKPGQFIPTS